MTVKSLDIGQNRLFLALDVIERVVVACLFSFFCVRMFLAFVEKGQLINLILIASEGLVVVFVPIRRSAKSVSLRPLDWLLAFTATAAPLLLRSSDAGPLLPIVVCTLLTVAGFILQVAAKLTLRRNFGVIAANRGITTGGPYHYVRHPMYSAYLLTGLGFILSNPSPWNIAVYLTGFGFQVARLLAEERLLGEDRNYREFSRLVPYRLVPKIF